jgi:hypothetical protein
VFDSFDEGSADEPFFARRSSRRVVFFCGYGYRPEHRHNKPGRPSGEKVSNSAAQALPPRARLTPAHINGRVRACTDSA